MPDRQQAHFNAVALGKTGLILLILLCGVALNFAMLASPAHAKPQEYEGEIPFKNSKRVKIHFYLSNDGKKVEKINFKMDSLELKPKDKKSGVDKMTLTDAELNDTGVYKITDGKLRSNSFFVFNLTVIDSCIYGTIGIKYDTDEGVMTADPVYAVIPNITTPKKIPENILKKK